MSFATQQGVSKTPYRTFPETGKPLEPVPFVTARRFWLLVYMLGGLSGIAMLIARFYFRPLFVRLSIARTDYQTTVREQLKTFISQLSPLITDLPGRRIIVDVEKHRLFVSTETQTEETPDPDTHDETSNAEPTKEDSPKLGNLVQALSEIDLRKEEDDYGELSGKMDDLKQYLQGFDSYSYRTLHSGFSSTQGDQNSTNDAVLKVKAEIRSVKGSLLNARTFHSVPSGRHVPP